MLLWLGRAQSLQRLHPRHEHMGEIWGKQSQQPTTSIFLGGKLFERMVPAKTPTTGTPSGTLPVFLKLRVRRRVRVRSWVRARVRRRV